jgi:predicted dehydrogenase
VHEISALRGLLGEPTEVRAADLSRDCVNVTLRFGDLRCQLTWLDLPGISSYRQEFAVFSPGRRLVLGMPSPYLKSLPSELIVETGEPGSPALSRCREIISYEEAFKRELVEFSDAVASGRRPRTAGPDGLADLAVCRAIVDAFERGEPVRPASNDSEGGR